MDVSLEVEGASLVFLGTLNPAIFHPAWFRAQNLISSADEADAKLEVVSPEVSVMTVRGLRVLVQRDRLQIELTGLDALGPARDLAAGTLTQLSHTPLTAMGFNYHSHFRIANLKTWHAIGHRLVPKDGIWDELLDEPGTMAVHVQGKRRKSSAKNTTIQAESSAKVTPGVYVGVNEHYAGLPIEDFVDVLGTEWEVFHRYARPAAKELLERAAHGS